MTGQSIVFWEHIYLSVALSKMEELTLFYGTPCTYPCWMCIWFKSSAQVHIWYYQLPRQMVWPVISSHIHLLWISQPSADMWSKPYWLIRLINLGFRYFLFNSGWSVWKYCPELNRRSGNRAPTYFMTVFFRRWPTLLPFTRNFINLMGAYSFFYHWGLLAGINYSP